MQIRSVVVVLLVAFGYSNTASAVAVARSRQPLESEDSDSDVMNTEYTAETAHSEMGQKHERMAHVEVSGIDATAVTPTDAQLEAGKPPTDRASSAPLKLKEAEPFNVADEINVAPVDYEEAASEPFAAAHEAASEPPHEQVLEKDIVTRLEAEVPADKADTDPTDEGGVDGSAQPATSTDSSFDATENAISLLHRKYAEERHATQHVKKELGKAIEWGQTLQRRLQSEVKESKAKQRKAQQFLARKIKEDAAAMGAEKKREHVLESLFDGANKSLVERTQQLRDTRAAYNKAALAEKKLSASSKRALRKERSKAIVLKGEVKKETALKVELKGKLERALNDISVARTEWRAEEARLLKSKALEDSRSDNLEANSTKARDELFSVKAAKQLEDREVTKTETETQTSLAVLKTQLSAAHGREVTLKKILEREHTKRKHNEEALQKDIIMWKKRADSEQTIAKKLGDELAVRSNGQREEVAKMKQNLSAVENETHRLQKDRAYIEDRLQGNLTKALRLEEEVKQLRLQLQNGEAAKAKAEASAKEAQQETAAAQAVAKQLSGTVPRLLKQAQLAHEAEEVEDVMLKREKIVEKKQVEADAPAAKTELRVIQKDVLPVMEASEITTAAPTEGELPGLDAKVDEAPTEQPADSSDSQQIAQDDVGLQQLLDED